MVAKIFKNQSLEQVLVSVLVLMFQEKTFWCKFRFLKIWFNKFQFRFPPLLKSTHTFNLKVAKVGIGLEVLRSLGIYANLLGVFSRSSGNFTITSTKCGQVFYLLTFHWY